MAQPYVGEIRMFAGIFAPAGWLRCEGQLLAISDYALLFNLIGTIYGGDGQVTFALPDMRGRAPLHQGNSQSGTSYNLGEMGGLETVTLTKDQIPAHNHAFAASTSLGTQPIPGANVMANSQGLQPYIEEPPDGTLNPATITNAGGNQPHSNIQPLLCVGFIISTYGDFPNPNGESE